MTSPPATSSPSRILEEDQPLSRSLLWRLQREFFDRQGMAAWSDGIVPSFITSNAWMANAYAQVALGWLRDGTALAGAGLGTGSAAFDPAQPIYLVELGSGSGRFGYLFLTRLLELVESSSLPDLSLRYVFSDAAEKNLEFLRVHPYLRELIAAGKVDFARFDAAIDTEMTLQISGHRLAPETLRNPLAVVANYLFDSIPQDVFTFRDGETYECAVTVRTEDGEEEPGPEELPGFLLSWRDRAVPPDYYGEPDLDRILQGYASALESSTVLFPSAGLRCLRRVADWSAGRLLLLSADKGYCEEAALAGLEPPGLVHHGSFSLMVNYHAIGRWFLSRGGGLLHASRPRSAFKLVAGLLGLPPNGGSEMRAAFDAAIERLGPDDLFALKLGVDQVSDQLDLETLLAWLRLTGWEPKVLLTSFPRLVSLAGSASEVSRRELRRAVYEVWNVHFPLAEAEDLAFCLGVLLCEIRCYREALWFLGTSLATHGDNPATRFNLALCLFHAGDPEAALAEVEDVLARAPDFAPAAALRARILVPVEMEEETEEE